MNGNDTMGTPGVYLHRSPVRTPRLRRRTDVTGFIGLTEDGRDDSPRRLESWVELAAELGHEDDLAAAVYGFFANGGRVCYVVQAVGYDEGLAAFETIEEISLVAIPGLGRLPEAELLRGQRHMLSHCARTGDRFAILDSLPDATADVENESPLGRQVANLRSQPTAHHGALYFPWLRSAAANGLLPPSGFVAGTFARTDTREGVHRAPANEVLRDVYELTRTVDDAAQGSLNEAGVNCLRAFPGRGIRVWGARTLSDKERWRYVPVRRMMLAIKDEIRHSLAWAAFEPINQTLRRAIAATLKSYLNGLYRANALAGESPEEAYFVQCDEETNPPHLLERGEVVARIGFAPLHPAEFLVVTVSRTAESVQVTAGDER